MNIVEFIKKAPKAELHLHIEGSLEPNQMFELAKRNNIKIPFTNVQDVKKAYNFSNLESFLKIYYEGAKVLVKEQDFYDLTWAYAMKCKQDNVVHTEIFFDPQTHVDRGINFDTVINGIYKALQKANKEFGLTFEIIMCFLRHLDEESAFETLSQAMPYKKWITAVGLDSSELGNPPSKFEYVFSKAIDEGFITVAHAGEEGPADYIWEAINLLKVSRIDHGNRSLDDDQLIKFLLKIMKLMEATPFQCPLKFQLRGWEVAPDWPFGARHGDPPATKGWQRGGPKAGNPPRSGFPRPPPVPHAQGDAA